MSIVTLSCDPLEGSMVKMFHLSKFSKCFFSYRLHSMVTCFTYNDKYDQAGDTRITLPRKSVWTPQKNCRLQSWTLYKSADCRWISITKLCVSFTNSATVARLEQVQLCNRLIDQSADKITDLKCAKECLILKYIYPESLVWPFLQKLQSQILIWGHFGSQGSKVYFHKNTFSACYLFLHVTHTYAWAWDLSNLEVVNLRSFGVTGVKSWLSLTKLILHFQHGQTS